LFSHRYLKLAENSLPLTLTALPITVFSTNFSSKCMRSKNDIEKQLILFIPRHTRFKKIYLIYEPYFSFQRTGNSQTEPETQQKNPG
jgi:hypothetical protein